MEFFAVLSLLIVLFVLVNLKNAVSDRLGNLESEVRQLRETVAAQKHAPLPVVPPAPVEEVPAPAIVPDVEVPEVKQPEISPEIAEWINTPTLEESPVFTAGEPVPQPTFVPASATPKPSFFERNPDLEKFIGENLVSKIGIAILVLAIGYFVKFAIDNNWIGEVGRVAIGIACGGILAGIAHYMRNSYKAFSSVLVGGGLAVFYFTIALAYHQFHLFEQSTAFVIMVVITGFAVVLSMLYDRQEVAIIALVGGFASPFMVSDGSGNYKTLFTYLILLNTGLLVLAYYKAWRLLNLLAFVFTVILFGGWLFSLPLAESLLTYRNAFAFSTVFYLLFFAINIANNIRENKAFLASDFSILLANTALYFTVGLYCLYHMQAQDYKGLFSASMGVFNLGASYLLFRKRSIDTNILYLLIGLTLTFISLAGPLQLQGNHITLFWASEAALLYWLFQKSKIPVLEITSAVVWVAMLVSLLMDWVNVYGIANRSLPVILNRAFITSVYAAAASYILWVLKKKDQPDLKVILYLLPANAFRIVALVLLFLAGIFEIHHQFHFHFPVVDLYWQYLELYTMVFVLAVVYAAKAGKKPLPANIQVVLLEFATIVYLLLTGIVFEVQSYVLQSGTGSTHFAFSHWFTVLFVAVILYKMIGIFRSARSVESNKLTIATWVICIVIIIFLSVETHMLVRSLFYAASRPLDYIQRLFTKTVLPILWGLCSFVCMWLGMKYKFRTLRIVSLVLFSITLLKLFIFDIRNIPVGGKIAAFFSLGVLLLVVSFMYQRLKKIIIEDEQKTNV